MNIKELAEQAGCAEINLYDVGKFIDLDLFAELILEQERKEAAEHYLKLIRDCVATERDKFWDALMSDLEHGVKSLNERASERFAKEYPALNREFNGDKHD